MKQKMQPFSSLANWSRQLIKQQDMTIGNPVKNLTLFAIPLLIGNLFQQLYSTVDSIVVGQFVGKEALAAIGSTFPVINLMLILFMGISSGAGIMVSQYYGAKQKDNLSKTIGTCVVLTIISSLLIMILSPVISRPMFVLLDTPPEVIDMATDYTNILFLGVLGSAFYNIFSGILRGMGDSIYPLLILIFTTVLNAILDVWFVAGLNMGVKGAAYATILVQFLSAIMCWWRMNKMKHAFEFRREYFRISKKFALQLANLGLPSSLMQMLFALSGVVVQRLTNSFGTDFMAASTVVMRVDGYAMMPNFTFGIAMSTFTGQNIGAKRLDRVEQGLKSGLRLGIMVSIILVSCLLLFGGNLMRLFTPEENIINMGMNMLRIISVGYIAMGISQILSGVMRGAGDTWVPMWISLLTSVFIRAPLAYLLAYITNNPSSIYWSLLIAWVSGTLLNTIAFRFGRWRKKSLVE